MSDVWMGTRSWVAGERQRRAWCADLRRADRQADRYWLLPAVQPAVYPIGRPIWARHGRNTSGRD